ncbi:uncharacterized protein LOC127830955 [Dreissena polymorpha]|uniref:uncharacterized protein LOC127830955 n=1 Tax=Dreissena polymorpha TaxID=45954 RepID=UPI002263BE23|nr:uncharacterized protein LOC127830955 [Dreissena polymorpha]
MRRKQSNPKKIIKHRGLYSPTALHNAYLKVKDSGLPVRTVAKQYGVPHTTLWDRVKGVIDPECLKPGPAPLFSQEEEVKLVDHVKTMAALGYGYTISEVVASATNYAVFLGKRPNDKPLSVKWFKGFQQRWPELRVVRPRALSNYRAKATSEANVHEYFNNLMSVVEKHDLHNKPECVYNIDEKGIQTEHTPPFIISGTLKAPAVTSSRSCVTTIIGCGNALGTQLPPFFVFKGKRLNADLLQGSTQGSSGCMSDSGWSNSAVFLHYMDTHFLRYVQRVDKSQPILVLLDGHKSHINVPVLDWAKKNNIILFILPAHTSHVLQPLDVGCFGPLQKIYNSMCHRFIRENPSTKITRYNVAPLGSAAYVAALSVENLRSAFKKSGVFPVDESAVSKEHFTTSLPYVAAPSVPEINKNMHERNPDVFFYEAEVVINKKKEFNNAKKKNNILEFTSGKEITDPIIEQKLRERAETTNEQKNKQQTEQSNKHSKLMPTKETVSQTRNKQLKKKQSTKQHTYPEPGPSHLNTDVESSEDDDETCCVCSLFQPKELANCVSLIFVKWAKCDFDNCSHWVHLQFCTATNVVRRNDPFYCPCHNIAEE